MAVLASWAVITVVSQGPALGLTAPCVLCGVLGGILLGSVVYSKAGCDSDVGLGAGPSAAP